MRLAKRKNTIYTDVFTMNGKSYCKLGRVHPDWKELKNRATHKGEIYVQVVPK